MKIYKKNIGMLIALITGCAMMFCVGCSHTAVIVIEKQMPNHGWNSKIQYEVTNK